MMKAQIVNYKEEGNQFYGFYYNGHFTACGFRFVEDIREFLLTCGCEVSPLIREVESMNQAIEGNQSQIKAIWATLEENELIHSNAGETNR